MIAFFFSEIVVAYSYCAYIITFSHTLCFAWLYIFYIAYIYKVSVNVKHSTPFHDVCGLIEIAVTCNAQQILNKTATHRSRIHVNSNSFVLYRLYTLLKMDVVCIIWMTRGGKKKEETHEAIGRPTAVANHITTQPNNNGVVVDEPKRILYIAPIAGSSFVVMPPSI